MVPAGQRRSQWLFQPYNHQRSPGITHGWRKTEMLIEISTLKTKALNVKRELNFRELPAFKTHISLTSSTSVSVSDLNAEPHVHRPMVGLVGGCEGPSPLLEQLAAFPSAPGCPPAPAQRLLRAPTQLHGAWTTRRKAPRRAAWDLSPGWWLLGAGAVQLMKR